MITAGQQVDFQPTVSGGTQPYNYSWSGLVSGTTFNVLAIPTTPGTYQETLVVTDSSNPQQSRTASCSVTVNPTPNFTLQGITTSVNLQAGQTGGPFQVSVTPTNGFTGTVTMTITGQPAGVTINPVSQTISGTASVTLSSNVVIAANASTGTFSLTATVGSGIVSKTCHCR